jgi:hypothetical protein
MMGIKTAAIFNVFLRLTFPLIYYSIYIIYFLFLSWHNVIWLLWLMVVNRIEFFFVRTYSSSEASSDNRVVYWPANGGCTLCGSSLWSAKFSHVISWNVHRSKDFYKSQRIKCSSVICFVKPVSDLCSEALNFRKTRRKITHTNPWSEMDSNVKSLANSTPTRVQFVYELKAVTQNFRSCHWWKPSCDWNVSFICVSLWPCSFFDAAVTRIA